MRQPFLGSGMTINITLHINKLHRQFISNSFFLKKNVKLFSQIITPLQCLTMAGTFRITGLKMNVHTSIPKRDYEGFRFQANQNQFYISSKRFSNLNLINVRPLISALYHTKNTVIFVTHLIKVVMGIEWFRNVVQRKSQFNLFRVSIDLKLKRNCNHSTLSLPQVSQAIYFTTALCAFIVRLDFLTVTPSGTQRISRI